MIIVSGWIRVDPPGREDFLEDSFQAMRRARQAQGCLDFHVSPDALEADRVNVYERWESVAAVEAFRGSGPSEDQSRLITDARVVQYEVDVSKAL